MCIKRLTFLFNFFIGAVIVHYPRLLIVQEIGNHYLIQYLH